MPQLRLCTTVYIFIPRICRVNNILFGSIETSMIMLMCRDFNKLFYLLCSLCWVKFLDWHFEIMARMTRIVAHMFMIYSHRTVLNHVELKFIFDGKVWAKFTCSGGKESSVAQWTLLLQSMKKYLIWHFLKCNFKFQKWQFNDFECENKFWILWPFNYMF